MKHQFNRLMFVTAFALLGMASITKPINPVHSDNVTVKLVLGKNATLQGQTASNDATIFHENVVTYTASSGSPLPTPTKEGTTFVSWVYAQNSELVRVSLMPLTSGAIYYAYWLGDGSLATGGGSSQPIPTDPVTLYLNTGGASLWNKDGARFYVYTFNQETAGAWPGTPMSLVSGDLYTAIIPGGFANVVFGRRDGTGTMEWNKTADLSYTPGSNLFTITDWSSGYWGTFS